MLSKQTQKHPVIKSLQALDSANIAHSEQNFIYENQKEAVKLTSWCLHPWYRVILTCKLDDQRNKINWVVF